MINQHINGYYYQSRLLHAYVKIQFIQSVIERYQ